MRLVFMVPLFLLCFLAVHFFKMMRFYLVLLEEKLPAGTFVSMYLRTTFVNFLIPFKLGEVYRAWCVVRLTKCAETGILSVVIDRFFDTIIVLLFLLPYDFLVRGSLSWVTGILLIFLLVVLLCYVMFEPTYFYLNRYLIHRSDSGRGIRLLGILEKIREWYDYTKNLIKGRQYLILLCSAAGWFAEFGLLSLLSAFYEWRFGLADYAAYLQSIFTLQQNELLTRYSFLSMIILLLFMIPFALNRLVRRRENEKKSVHPV